VQLCFPDALNAECRSRLSPFNGCCITADSGVAGQARRQYELQRPSAGCSVVLGKGWEGSEGFLFGLTLDTMHHNCECMSRLAYCRDVC